jgi:hypothetical protein
MPNEHMEAFEKAIGEAVEVSCDLKDAVEQYLYYLEEGPVDWGRVGDLNRAVEMMTAALLVLAGDPEKAKYRKVEAGA